MKYENKELEVSFTMPDALSVRQQLDYRSRLIDHMDDNAFLRNWLALMPIVEDWKCKAIPDPATFDPDEATDKSVADIIFWSSNEMAGHMLELDDVPKNS
jgi:hypothetical protein